METSQIGGYGAAAAQYRRAQSHDSFKDGHHVRLLLPELPVGQYHLLHARSSFTQHSLQFDSLIVKLLKL